MIFVLPKCDIWWAYLNDLEPISQLPVHQL
jgi:hypothetical protein